MRISDWSSDVCSSDLSRAAMRRAIDVARGAGRKVAFTLSDAFIIDRHGEDFRALIAAGLFDILFAHAVETKALAGAVDFDAPISKTAPPVPLPSVTRRRTLSMPITRPLRPKASPAPTSAVAIAPR